MKTKKSNTMTIEQKKAKRAEYAKRYYAQLKAKKNAQTKLSGKSIKTDKKISLTKKNNEKKVSVKSNVMSKKFALNKKTANKPVKNTMKSAYKLFDKTVKTVSNIKKCSKEIGKFYSEVLKTNDQKYIERVNKLFSRIGYNYLTDKSVIEFASNAKVKTPKIKKSAEIKIEIATDNSSAKTKKKYAKKTDEVDDTSIEVDDEKSDDEDENAETEDVENLDNDDNDEIDDDCSISDSRDREMDDDALDNMHEMEEAMHENGEWED